MSFVSFGNHVKLSPFDFILIGPTIRFKNMEVNKDYVPFQEASGVQGKIQSGSVVFGVLPDDSKVAFKTVQAVAQHQKGKPMVVFLNPDEHAFLNGLPRIP